jgi:hypothetical protein
MRYSRSSSFRASRNAGLNIRLNLLALRAPRSNSPWYAFTLNNQTPNATTPNARLRSGFLLAASSRFRCNWVAGRNNKMRMGNTVVMRNLVPIPAHGTRRKRARPYRCASSRSLSRHDGGPECPFIGSSGSRRPRLEASDPVPVGTDICNPWARLSQRRCPPFAAPTPMAAMSKYRRASDRCAEISARHETTDYAFGSTRPTGYGHPRYQISDVHPADRMPRGSIKRFEAT